MTSILITYLLILLSVYLFQSRLLYLPGRYDPDDLIQLATQVGLEPWPNQENYRGFINKKNLNRSKGTILVFHGNAGSAINRFFYIEALERLGFRVIITEYPGYGARGGKPSEIQLIADGVQTAQLALDQFGGPLYLWGESLGCGVASGVIKTGQVSVKGLVLLTPFDNLPDVAQRHYWFVFGKWLTREKFNNVENLQDYPERIAVLLACDDEIVPKRSTLNLYESLSSQKKLWEFENSSHNNLPLQPTEKWWREVMEFTAK
ncbi:MAG: alpha/beta hydrolase [Methylococcus sp.]|nr:MAG: alpha/beta hydrolase [Methylococcus sp.]